MSDARGADDATSTTAGLYGNYGGRYVPAFGSVGDDSPLVEALGEECLAERVVHARVDARVRDDCGRGPGPDRGHLPGDDIRAAAAGCSTSSSNAAYVIGTSDSAGLDAVSDAALARPGLASSPAWARPTAAVM